MNPFQKLYPYQIDAVNQTKSNDKGIVCMPTGVGKTYCEAAIVADDIINNPGFNIYVLNAPRILLSYQLLKEVYKFLVNSGIESRYMFVHSGGKMDDRELEDVRKNSLIPFSNVDAGTSVDNIYEMMKKAYEGDLPVIFFSTYNSAERIEEARQKFDLELVNTDKRIQIRMVINDEAHYLVQEQFHDILNDLPSPRCYFFTATMIHTPDDKGMGMNNIESYGPVLYQMLPIDAIRMGKMVRPRIHVVKSDGIYVTEDYDKSLNRIIYEAFHQHEKVLSSKNVLPKLLISTKGTNDILRFLESKEYVKLREEGIEVYAVSSNLEIENQINGQRINSRSEFLKRLKKDGEDDTKKLIVLHYDILAEGIDVSGFTGIMPLRTLSKSKFLQTYGRSARLHPEDRKRVDNKEISFKDNDFKDKDKMRKPYSYIIIPHITHSNKDDETNMVNLIGELRTFGFKPFEEIISSSYVHGVPEIEELTGQNELQTKLPNYGRLIEKLEAQLEAEEEAKLDKLTLLKKLFQK